MTLITYIKKFFKKTDKMEGFTETTKSKIPYINFSEEELRDYKYYKIKTLQDKTFDKIYNNYYTHTSYSDRFYIDNFEQNPLFKPYKKIIYDDIYSLYFSETDTIIDRSIINEILDLYEKKNKK